MQHWDYPNREGLLCSTIRHPVGGLPLELQNGMSLTFFLLVSFPPEKQGFPIFYLSRLDQGWSGYQQL